MHFFLKVNIMLKWFPTYLLSNDRNPLFLSTLTLVAFSGVCCVSFELEFKPVAKDHVHLLGAFSALQFKLLLLLYILSFISLMLLS